MMAEAEDDDYQSDIISGSFASLTKRKEKSVSLSSRSEEPYEQYGLKRMGTHNF
jgi:hypothetical protein